MMPTEIADTLNHLEWDALRSFCAPCRELPLLNRETIQQLVKADLLRLEDDCPAITTMGRKVVVCGSPRLWNS